MKPERATKGRYARCEESLLFAWPITAEWRLANSLGPKCEVMASLARGESTTARPTHEERYSAVPSAGAKKTRSSRSSVTSRKPCSTRAGTVSNEPGSAAKSWSPMRKRARPSITR